MWAVNVPFILTVTAYVGPPLQNKTWMLPSLLMGIQSLSQVSESQIPCDLSWWFWMLAEKDTSYSQMV